VCIIWLFIRGLLDESLARSDRSTRHASEHAPVLQSRILGGGNGATRSRTKAYLPNTHRTVRLYRICNHRPAQKQTHPLFYTIPASSRGPSPRYNNPPSHRRRIPFVGKAVSLKLVLLELGAVFFAAVSSAAPRQHLHHIANFVSSVSSGVMTGRMERR
jgi:hypothetical protein